MKKYRWLRRIAKLLVVLIVILVGAITILWWFTKPTPPDQFYVAPPNTPIAPGSLIRSEPFTRQVPSNARAWRVLYSTTKFDGTIAPASAIVLAPSSPSGSPMDVVAWAHGTTGVAPPCAPSVMAEPFANVPALEEALAAGWVVVATDYIGLGTAGPHPYLIGEGEARSTLDSIRALKQLKELSVTDRTVVWGHSQGGHAALWTGILAPIYAPELKLEGISAAAPATDLIELERNSQDTPVGRILSSYIITAYSSRFPEVHFDAYIRPFVSWLTHDMAARCMGGKEALFLAGQALLLRGSIFSTDPTSGTLGQRLQENRPDDPINVPVMIAQGEIDELVLLDIQKTYVNERCRAGQALEFVTYLGRNHLSLVAKNSPYSNDLVEWTRARFEGKPTQSGCITTIR